uniref:C2H2-type domain-containing protein n=1 Tax=Romanomermis culicivorax TaxID=13658 RepID=A0A915I4S4_ROMCU
MTSLAINPADINLLMTSSDPYFYQQQRNSQQNNMINNQLLSDPDPHLDNVINFLTSNCASNNNQNQSIQNDHNSMIERTRNTNRSRMNNEERAIRQQPSPILAAPSHNERHEQQHELVTPTDEGPPSGQFETHMPPNMTSSLTVANPMSLDFVQTPPSAISNNSTGSIHYRNSPRPNVQIMPSVTVIPVKGISSPAVTVAVSDPKKLKGAAKRKASFHNLTNNNSSNTNTNTAQGQAKIGENSGQSSCSLAIEPMKFMGEDRKQDETKNSLNSNNNNVLYHQANGENNTGIIDNSANDTITTAAADIGNSRRNNELINNINPMDQCVVDALNTLLDQRNVINDYQSINQQHLHSQGHHSNHVTFMETESFREYLNGDVNQVVTSATSMSPRLGSTNNELVDNLSNLTDSDWRNMKLEYDAFAPVPPTVPYVAATVAPTPVRKSAILAPPPPLSGTHRIQMQQNAAAVHSPSLKVSSPMHQQQRIATPESISCRSAAVSTPGCSSSSVAARLLQQTTRCLTPADETSYTVTAAVRDVSESPDSRVLSMDGVLSYFKCLICDKSFQMGLAHMAQHVSNDSTTCTFCNDSSRFDSKEELIKHMMSHSARVYACQYCGKENPRVHYLKIHVRSHTGEKPYTCHQCGRGFADASTWRRHERLSFFVKSYHFFPRKMFWPCKFLLGVINLFAGEKPYQCNICGRKIARRDNVKIHMRSHMRTKHGTACRVCGKTFTQPNHLMLHERVCTNAAEGASPSPHGSPIGVGNAAVMAAAADQSAVNALLTVSPSCVSPAAAISD